MARTDYFPHGELAPPGIEALILAHRQHRRRRWGIFLLLWVLISGTALAYVWQRTPRYEVTGLLSFPVAQTEAPLPLVDLALQRQELLAGELLAAVLSGLADGPESVEALRQQLSVAPVGGSMLELRAIGADPELLNLLANRWMEVYLAQSESVRNQELADTDQLLDQELAVVAAELEAQREALAGFRAEHDIVSLERQDNTAANRLRGLGQALNEANQAAVAAAAELAAVESRLAQGQLPESRRKDPEITTLERELERIRERFRDLERRFTPAYLALDPDVVTLRETLKSLERQLTERRRVVAETTLAEARQAEASTRGQVQALEQQIAEFRDTASEFAGYFQEYQSLVAALERWETRQRELQDRQAAAEAALRQERPAAQVVDRPRLPEQPVWPDYRRDSLLALGGGLGLALLGVLIFDFLGRPLPGGYPPHWQSFPAAYPPASRVLAAEPEHPQLTAPPLTALPTHQPLELPADAVSALLEVADTETRALLGLALSGLAPAALVMLDWAELSADRRELRAGGQQLLLEGPPRDWLLALDGDTEGPVWRDARGFPRSGEELDALLCTAAHDAGLTVAERVDLAALRHTYLAFLARQGVRLAELSRLAGLAPGEVERYRSLAPPGRGRPLAELSRVYPSLAPAAGGVAAKLDG